MTIVERARSITGGVDTHADVHVAAALNELGALLGTESFPTTPAGYDRLFEWLESAHLPRRVGGIATVAEALAAGQPSTAELMKLSKGLHLETGLRRLLSLDDQLGLGKIAAIDLPTRIGRPLALDPSDPRDDGPIDTRVGVRWSGPIDELAEVVNQ